MSLARVQALLVQLNQDQTESTRFDSSPNDDDDSDDEGGGGETGDGDGDDEGENEENDENDDDHPEDGEDDEEEEEEEEEDDDGPKTIDEFFEDPGPRYDKEFIVHNTFHTLYVAKDNTTVLMRLNRARMKRLFYVQLTHEASEGLFSSMFDITPKNVGLCFLPAPARGGSESKNVLLVEAQQSFSSSDLMASLYDPDFGGLQSGLIREFTPIVDDEVNGDVLIDVTFWLTSFAMYANAAGMRMREKMREDEEADAAGIGAQERGCACGAAGYHPGTHTRLFEPSTNGTSSRHLPPPPPCSSPWLGWNEPSHRMDDDGGGVVANLPPMPLGGGGMFGGGHAGGSKLLEVASFPRNFVLKFRSQLGHFPLKVRPGSMGPMHGNPPRLTTSYFTVAFCLLPDMPMVPRPLDHRVGYFTSSTRIGSPQQLTLGEKMINKWNLARRGNKLLFCISRTTPPVYHSTIKEGVLSWNKAFAAAGYSQPVLQCLAPNDVGYPDDMVKGDARYNVIAMAEPPGLLGYGPSVVDFRSGEILVAHVLLGLTAFSSSASRWSSSPSANQAPRWSGRGCKMPLLDPTHPWILKELLHTVAHEIGHTLGLRHNFIASEDGHTSVMAYEDPIDTTHLDPLGHDAGAPALSNHLRLLGDTTPSATRSEGGLVQSAAVSDAAIVQRNAAETVRFGAHYCMGPGSYDVYAIRYGYTRLAGESRLHRHPGLDLLANGQSADDPNGLSPNPQNPLFMTDENMYGARVDPRVNVFFTGIRRMGRDKMAFARQQRGPLLQRVQAGEIVPLHYCSRVFAHVGAVTRTLYSALDFVGGTQIDARRDSLRSTSPDDIRALVRSVVDFLTGDAFRFSAEESKYLVVHDNSGGYGMKKVRPFEMHEEACEHLIAGIAEPNRLRCLEEQFAEASRAPAVESTALARQPVAAAASSAPNSLDTLGILSLLAFGSGDTQPPLLHPLQFALGDTNQQRFHTQEDNGISADVLRAKARVCFAAAVRDVAQSAQTHPSVRAQALLLISKINQALRKFGVAPALAASSVPLSAPLPPRPRGMSELAQSHWQVFCDELNKEKKSEGGAISCVVM